MSKHEKTFEIVVNDTRMTELFVLSPMSIPRHISGIILNKLSEGDVYVIIVSIGFIILGAVCFNNLLTRFFAASHVSSHKLVFVSRKHIDSFLLCELVCVPPFHFYFLTTLS